MSKDKSCPLPQFINSRCAYLGFNNSFQLFSELLTTLNHFFKVTVVPPLCSIELGVINEG